MKNDDLCDVCRRNKAVISITGIGQYCLDCHNLKMLRRAGIDNTFEYPDTISVIDSLGKAHSFKIEHFIIGSMVSWEAIGFNNKYHFKEMSSIWENGTEAAKTLFQKISDGVSTKTVECYNSYLKNKGTINIVENEESGEIEFEIDGEIYSPSKLSKMLSPYVNFSLKYQIFDLSEPILKDDDYLIPIDLSQDSILGGLETSINIISNRGFVSYKDVPTMDDRIAEVINELRVLSCNGRIEDALIIGKEVARMIREIETDDDYFPEYHLDILQDIIDPLREDEELRNIIASAYN